MKPYVCPPPALPVACPGHLPVETVTIAGEMKAEQWVPSSASRDGASSTPQEVVAPEPQRSPPSSLTPAKCCQLTQGTSWGN